MNSKLWIGVGGVLLLGILTTAWWYTTTPREVVAYALPLATGDMVASYFFQGAYTGKPDLITKAEQAIDDAKNMLGGEHLADYEIYVSIANQYDLMGNGKKELEYLGKAITVDSTTGLAWHNAGALFDRLGATATARASYERAVEVQPIKLYFSALIDFLKRRYPGDTQAIRDLQGRLENTVEFSP